MNTGIYCIKHETNGKLYIGSTAESFSERWRKHLILLKRHKHHSPHLQHAWDKYKESNFNFIILEKVIPQDCISREQWFLDNWPHEYNVCSKAASCLGIKRSSASKLKMRLSALGRKHSIATRTKMSIQRRAENLSPEIRQKLSIHAKQLNKIKKVSVLQLDRTTGSILKKWESLSDAASIFIKNQKNLVSAVTHISDVCKNKPNFNTAYGFKWRFA